MKLDFLVGSYSKAPDGGIFRVEADTDDLASATVTLAAPADEPSWITWTPERTHLIAVEERLLEDAPKIHAFSATGNALTPTGTAPLPGMQACHIGVHPHHPLAVSCHYGDGSFALWQVAGDGLPRQRQSLRQEGSGPNRDRQDGPHAHFCAFIDGGDGFLVADLGSDAIHHYRLGDPATDPAASYVGSIALPPGCGPRHFTVEGEGARLTVACELDETLRIYTRDGDGWTAAGTVEPFGPCDVEGAISAIRLSEDGKFLYVAGRRQREVAVLATGPGLPEVVARTEVGGRTPRDMVIAPTGSLLIVANQDSSALTFFARDPDKGTLTRIGGDVAVPTPSCILF
ncbi:lactonase family protein [Pelagovum pacificum]|uniref:Lactonase family protein n=1 Tax=Pelagovum pacificum TaxID=2588711 RepID=A0A5C5G7B3_9RHOB|nr:beta-propeller fold lactonase family protein [Pelagovum pacificum]QQA41907.1 lactonase family protein [Pelagovum pacificum]TNY30653.1 lactonase family protein [Pelagovum pacificum]